MEKSKDKSVWSIQLAKWVPNQPSEMINEFLSRDPGAGKSNITVNAARVGLTTKAAFVGSSVRGISSAPGSTAASSSTAEMQNETT